MGLLGLFLLDLEGISLSCSVIRSLSLSDQKIAMAEHREIQSSASQPEPAAVKGAAEKGAESPNLMGHHKSPRHNKETHGTSDDIDDSTPIDEVKGPSLLHRVKEEIEAVVESVLHPKK